jgi:NhaP-type Na+/H+ or K+/H+ antiporter
MAVETAASVAESFLYVYLGLSALTIKREYVVTSLIVVVIIATILSRIISVFIPMLVMYLFKGSKLGLKFKEILLITFGGSIRGAIAFGLCLGINTANSDMIKTTVQIVVLFTTVVFGSTIGLFANTLDIKPDSRVVSDSDLT